MEGLILLAVIIGGLVFVVCLVKGSSRRAEITQAIDVTYKIKHILDWLTQNLDSKKLESGDEKYIHYFIAYFDECARAACAMDGVDYHDGNRFLVYLEASKRCGDGVIEDAASIEKSKTLLEKIRTTEFGQCGVKDGKNDGEYVAEPSNPGPYFNHALAYFGQPPAQKNVD